MGSQITYPDPLLPKAWPAQPDSGDCWAIQVPGAPGATAAVVDPRHNWYNYALLSGWWNRQLYGTQLPGGRLSYVYTNGVGHTYIVDLSGLVITGAGSNLFGGTVKLSSTQVSISPPAAINIPTQVAGAPPNTPNLTLDAARGIWDIVAINKTGSEVVLGFWPQTYAGSYPMEYSSGQACRGIARFVADATPFRTVPYTYVKLSLTEGTAELSMLKTAAESSVLDTNTVSVHQGSLLRAVYADSSCGWVIDTCPVGAFCSDPLYDWVPSSSTSDTSVSRELLLGCFYKSDGTLTWVSLVGTLARHQVNTAYGVDLACENPWDAQAGLDIVEDCEIALALKVGEAVKSSLTGMSTNTTTIIGHIFTDESTTVSDPSATLVLDGVNLLPTEVFSIAGYANTDHINALLLIGAFLSSTRVHGVRYSNHAFGIALTGLIGAHPAYLGGIVNVLDGNRTAPIGFKDAPNHTADYPYTSYHVTVQPMTQTLSHGVSPVCYV